MEGVQLADGVVRRRMGLTKPSAGASGRDQTGGPAEPPSGSASPADRTPRAVYLFVGGLTVVLVAILVLAGWPDAMPLEHALAWTVLTGLFATVEFTDLSFHSNRGRVGLSGAETILCPMVVGLPFPLAIWGATLGIAVVQASRRRTEPVKAAFNVAQYGCAAAASTAVWRWLSHSGAGFGVRNALVATGAMLAFTVVTHVLTLQVIVLAQGRFRITVSRDVVTAALWNATAGIALGLLFAGAFTAGEWAVVLFPAPLAVLYLGVRAVLRQSRERERVEALHSATRALAANRELEGAVAGFLEAVAHAVGSSGALVVVSSGGRVRWSEIGPSGVVATLQPAEQGPRHHLLASVTRAGLPIVITEDRPSPDDQLAVRLGFRNLAAVPLFSEGRVIGCLAAYDRIGADEFGEPETRLLEALGGEFVITVEANRLFDEAAEQRERFQRVFEDGPLGMAIVDRDLRLTVVNKALCAMLGYEEAELTGTSLLAIAHPDDAWSDAHRARQALRGDIPGYQVEKRYVAKNGSVVPVNLTATVVRDQRGQVLYGLHIIEDIADRKRAEQSLQTYAQDLADANRELRAASELKDHFLAVTNHELRTPLTSILGFATMLGDGWDRLPDEDRREFVWRIHGQAERLAKLIDDLLTLSSAQAGALEVSSAAVALEPAIRDAINAIGPAGQEVRVRCRPDLRVMANPEGLLRILSNLLTNAFTHGAPPVTIEAREGTDWVEIRVTDRGAGVPPDFVGRLFEKFAQANRAASRSHGGTGLGLAIVRELAQAQGGEAWYEQGPMGGATFCIRLPAAAADAAEAAPHHSLSRTAG